jgi:hypothetical protein
MFIAPVWKGTIPGILSEQEYIIRGYHFKDVKEVPSTIIKDICLLVPVDIQDDIIFHDNLLITRIKLWKVVDIAVEVA